MSTLAMQSTQGEQTTAGAYEEQAPTEWSPREDCRLGSESVASRRGFCRLKSEQYLLGLFILLKEDAAPDSKVHWRDVLS